MDPNSQYKRQLEYYEYFEKQLENPTDLAHNLDNPNDSVIELAKILFNKSKNYLNYDLSGAIFDESMDVADVFCMLVELVLYGLDILSKGKTTIFNFEDSLDDIIYTIKSYLKSIGFDMIVINRESNDNNNIFSYHDSEYLFCEIVPKPPVYLCYDGWYVLNYCMINNNKFNYSKTTPLDTFKAFFVADNKQIFTISFKFV